MAPKTAPKAEAKKAAPKKAPKKEKEEGEEEKTKVPQPDREAFEASLQKIQDAIDKLQK
eukprot:CAMPEP_0197646472 /NCGR_PEP_ID=MMETSP1338-20131121/23447_1 /TAXON_ID=43686 ORGANISM="Pelagodinium beii, Strain RCC1491" /NCGR_SAMPLE_ID=MMETSP1338 /ASSEMBLY_ACC=CAM_ASM_000754 /LENGTH=58 /DNA_ID=CAMNT_0043220109 /DNA_START=61 /DNA_END=234 /DNA_ORIENTATION=+